MKQILRDTGGSTSLLAAFLAAVLCILAVVVYAGMMVYSNFQAARTDLERAAIVSIDKNMLNPNVEGGRATVPGDAEAATCGQQGGHPKTSAGAYRGAGIGCYHGYREGG